MTTPAAAHPATTTRFEHALAILRRIIGVPDYDAYTAHMTAHHPGKPLLSVDEFADERLKSKYSKPGQRCC